MTRSIFSEVFPKKLMAQPFFRGFSKKKLDLSIIIPAHNEENRIEGCIRSYVKALPKEGEMIVVCNACNDRTPETVKALAKKDERIKLVEIRELGKGIALSACFRKAKGKIVGFLDADNAFNPNDVKAMIDDLRKARSFEGVIGSKWLGQSFSSVEQPFYRKLLGRSFNFLATLLFGLGYADTQCGAKFFKENAAQVIKRHDFSSKSYTFDVELLYLLKAKNLKLKEAFIKSKHEVGSKVNLGVVPKMFIDLIKLRLKGIE